MRYFPLHCVQLQVHIYLLSLKFKRVSLDKTPEFPFWGPNICLDFDLRDSKKIENINKLNKIILIFINLPDPFLETRVLKLVFRTIPCLNFWAQRVETRYKTFKNNWTFILCFMLCFVKKIVKVNPWREIICR